MAATNVDFHQALADALYDCAEGIQVESSRLDIETRLEVIYGCMVEVPDGQINQDFHEALDLVESVLDTLQKNVNKEVLATTRGRPAYHIDKEHLCWFIEKGFTVKSVANILGVSESTVWRRLKEYNLTLGQKYSTLSDEELDIIVLEKIHNNPNSGFRMIQGMLLTEGYCIQQHRVLESIRRVDPVGTSLRGLMLNVIKRRSYEVPGPQSLWHIDGNHKLIR